MCAQVFCSKRDPNCSACPLRSQCEYAQANGRHLKKRRAPSSKADPDPQPAKAPRQGSHTETPTPQPADAGGNTVLLAPVGTPVGTGPDRGTERPCQDCSEPAEGPDTPRAEAAPNPSVLARKGGKAPSTPAQSACHRADAILESVISDSLSDPAADPQHNVGEGEVEAAMPDIEDLGGAAGPGSASRAQGEELERILGTGDVLGQPLDANRLEVMSGNPDPRCGQTWRLSSSNTLHNKFWHLSASGQLTDNLPLWKRRLLEAATAVLDLTALAEHNDGHASEDITVFLQRLGAMAIRRRFRELSVVVHPDKCTLPGAQQVLHVDFVMRNH